MTIDIARREFIATLGAAAAAWPLAARAQQTKRVGVLMNGAATEAPLQTNLESFVAAMRQLAWIEGQTIRFDVRWSAGEAALAKLFAGQLVGLQPDAILAVSTQNLIAVRQATSSTAVVFAQISDPVAQGFVTNITRPGGNLTGFSQYEFSIGGKWLDLLKEAAPGLARVGVMFNPETSPQSTFFMHAVEVAAAKLGVEATAIPVRTRRTSSLHSSALPVSRTAD